jgi:hypothetical protein
MLRCRARDGLDSGKVHVPLEHADVSPETQPENTNFYGTKSGVLVDEKDGSIIAPVKMYVEAMDKVMDGLKASLC